MNKFFNMLGKDKLEVSRKKMIREHKALVAILRSKDRSKQLSEAYKQERELSKLEKD